jgi:hypothetical protein
VLGWSVNDKLERMWKEQLGANLGYCPGFCLERLRKTMKPSVRLAVVPINIQNFHLSDRYQKCNHLNHLV